jgi:hypothetical protein
MHTLSRHKVIYFLFMVALMSYNTVRSISNKYYHSIEPLVSLSANTITLVSAFVATLLVFSTYINLFGLEVFGHDEVHYYADFGFKLREDGRWINYFLHDLLRSIPPRIWAVLLVATEWLLFYKIAECAVTNRESAILISACMLLAAPLAWQSVWPATTIPAVGVLLFSHYLIKRNIAYPKVYIITGILIFGTMQSFYFLLPLFYLQNFLGNSNLTENRSLLLFKHLCWWLDGSIAGVLFMSILLWLIVDHFGFQTASWCKPHPIHNLSDLVRNIKIGRAHV